MGLADPALNQDFLEQVDRDYDGVLSEKEEKAYQNYEKRVQTVRQLLPEGIKSHLDLAYVEQGHPRHRLDLYLPQDVPVGEPLPLVIWIHGGGWHKGSKELFGLQGILLEQGFAVGPQ